MKSKNTAGILAIFLGNIGVHRFYLNQIGVGILYLLFCWTFIPAIIAFVEGLIFLTMDESKFNLKYNKTSETKNSVPRHSSILHDTIRQESKQPEENNSVIINHANIQVVELNAIEKLQFKKFIAEQSGMNINEVDNYLESILTEEKTELITDFRKSKETEIRNENTNNKFNATFIPTVNVIQDDPSQPSCPKCRSKQVAYNKKGFGAGRAIGGALLLGPLGLLAGATAKNKILLTCLKCGHRWRKG
jgi:TM2 domain-containing membrane protein YozV